MTKKLGSDYYKAKGEVVDVVDDYTAHVALFDKGKKQRHYIVAFYFDAPLPVLDEIVKVDQEHLETVIPAVGKDMRIVNGAYRGCKAVLQEILEQKFKVRLRVKEGPSNGRIVDVAYEDASKCA